MAVKPSHILGMNGRYRYTASNSSDARKFGFSKLRTKELLKEHKIPTAEIYHVFETLDDLENINWETIPTPFVIKPASGSAGKGIWVILSKTPDKPLWKDNNKETLTAEDLSLHISNILDGEFSTWGSNHKALIEEMIPAHPDLGRYSYRGTPDVRVIIYNSIPVMAMARIPTKESGGRANLDQGALGLGIDIASGTTTYGIQGKGKPLTHFPNSKKKIRGVQIPFWHQVLKVAVQAARAAGYSYMGADLFIHPERGPMIVELNGFPGLSIQLSNKAGLKNRMNRVRGLEVVDAEHGVKIAQALFSEGVSEKVKTEQGMVVISHKPTMTVYGDQRKQRQAQALVNTGRFRSAISQKLAQKLGLFDLDDLLWRQQEGLEGKLPVVELRFKLKGKTVKTAVVVSKKLNSSKFDFELGRKDLSGFLVGDAQTGETPS